MTDTTRDLLINLSSHMAYMQGQLEARHELDDPEDFYWYRESVLLRQKVTDALVDEPVAVTGQPSDEELLQMMPEQFRADLATVSRMAAHGAGTGVTPGVFRVSLNTGALDYARAVLTRWGTPNLAETRRSLMGWGQDAQLILRAAELLQRQMLVLVPVSVSERLPGPADCDAEGRCWWYAKRYGWEVHHHKQPRSDLWTHWLSTQTLPIPHQQETNND